MRKSTRRIGSSKRRQSRRKMRGGALKEEALAYLQLKKIDPEDLLSELVNKKPKESSITHGDFVFKSRGVSHSFYLDVKKKGNNNTKYEESIYSVHH